MVSRAPTDYEKYRNRKQAEPLTPTPLAIEFDHMERSVIVPFLQVEIGTNAVQVEGISIALSGRLKGGLPGNVFFDINPAGALAFVEQITDALKDLAIQRSALR